MELICIHLDGGCLIIKNPLLSETPSPRPSSFYPPQLLIARIFKRAQVAWLTVASLSSFCHNLIVPVLWESATKHYIQNMIIQVEPFRGIWIIGWSCLEVHCKGTGNTLIQFCYTEVIRWNWHTHTNTDTVYLTYIKGVFNQSLHASLTGPTLKTAVMSSLVFGRAF